MLDELSCTEKMFKFPRKGCFTQCKGTKKCSEVVMQLKASCLGTYITKQLVYLYKYRRLNDKEMIITCRFISSSTRLAKGGGGGGEYHSRNALNFSIKSRVTRYVKKYHTDIVNFTFSTLFPQNNIAINGQNKSGDPYHRPGDSVSVSWRLMDNLRELAQSLEQAFDRRGKIKLGERSEPSETGFLPLQTTLGYLRPPVVFLFLLTQSGAFSGKSAEKLCTN